jgi:hypothetical protein
MAFKRERLVMAGLSPEGGAEEASLDVAADDGARRRTGHRLHLCMTAWRQALQM